MHNDDSRQTDRQTDSEENTLMITHWLPLPPSPWCTEVAPLVECNTEHCARTTIRAQPPAAQETTHTTHACDLKLARILGLVP